MHNQQLQFRYFYNSQNESALKTALLNNSFEIYELLLSHQVFFGPHEDADTIMDAFNEDERRQLRDINFRHFQGSPEKHINILLANSFIAYDTSEQQKKLTLIQNAFRVINKDPHNQVILMAVAASKKFRIIFDFNRDSVQMIDPSTDPYTNGMFYLSWRIYIGARQLLNEDIEEETFATMAHELGHYAMNLAFKNAARPYTVKDKKAAQEMDKVSQECYEKREKETLIDLVYDCYPEEMHHAELIVRPPHLIALHYKNPQKLKESRENYGSLFGHYENKVIPFIQRSLPEIEASADKLIEKKDRIISHYKKLLFVSFLITIAVGLAGYLLFSPVYMWNELSANQQDKVRNGIVNYKNVNVKLKDLFSNDSQVYEKLTSEQIRKIFSGKILNLADPDYLTLSYYLHHDWTNLTEKLKQKILNTDLSFQSQTVKFTDIQATYPESLSSLSSSQIIDILDQKNITVGSMIENRTIFFIERKFMPENVVDIFHAYSLKQRLTPNDQKIKPGGVTVRGQQLRDQPHTNMTFAEFYNTSGTRNERGPKPAFETDGVDGFNIFNSMSQWIRGTVSEELVNETFIQENFNHTIKETDGNKIFILSSEAGAGKTITFQQLSMIIKREYPMRWVAYIALRDYIEYYKEDYLDVENLLKNMFNLNFEEKKFERKIFENSFRNGQVILLWDGFDEIVPTYEKFMLNVLNFIKNNTTNVQYISTRPLYSKKLQNEFKFDPYILVPFSKVEKVEFLTKFFRTRNETDDEITQNILKVEKIVESFEYTSPNELNPRKFNTPLMLILVAEVQDDSNTTITNYYQIYQTFLEKKVRIWQDKSAFAKQVISKALISSTRFSLLEIFHRYSIVTFVPVWAFIYFPIFNKAAIMRKKIPEELSYEEITRIGILFINEKYKFQFAHKTFTEFFIAQYIVENVYNEEEHLKDIEAHARLEMLFVTFKTFKRFQIVVTEFLRSYLMTQDGNGNQTFNGDLAKMLRSKYKPHLISYLTEGTPGIFECFGDFFKKDHNLLVDLLGINDDRTFYTELFNPMNEVFFIDPSEVARIYKSYLSDEEYERFIHGTNQKGVIMLGMFYFKPSNTSKVHETLRISSTFSDFWEFYDQELKLKLNDKELKELFISPASAVMYVDYSTDDSERFWTEVENVLVKEDEIATVINNAYNYLFKIIKEFPSFDEVPLITRLINETRERLNDLAIYKLFLSTNLVHKAAYTSNSFKLLWNFLKNHTTFDQRRELLMKKDNGSYFFTIRDAYHRSRYLHGSYYPDYFHHYDRTPNTVFHNALLVNDQTIRELNNESFSYAADIYREHFKRNELKNLILESNLYIVRLIDHGPPEVTEKFKIFLEELFKGDEEVLKEFLLRKIGKTGLNVFDAFKGFENRKGSEIERNRAMFISVCNCTGDNVL